MGGEKSTQQGSQTRTATPEETRLNQLDLALREAGQSGLMNLQNLGMDLSSRMLQGQTLPGQFGNTLYGLNENQISDISQKAVRDIMPGFQSSGILDSGVAAEVAGRTAGDVRRQAAEFNVGALQNLLNLALSGQAQIQQPTLATGASVGNRLSQLGTTTSSGSTIGMNPFLKSFQSNMGEGLSNWFNPQTYIKPR